MRSNYQMPNDVPHAACGRCEWWKQNTMEGWGRCVLLREKRWYKCMVCPEYEVDLERAARA